MLLLAFALGAAPPPPLTLPPLASPPPPPLSPSPPPPPPSGNEVILGAHNAGCNRVGLGRGGLWWGENSFASFVTNHYYSIPTLLDMNVRMFEVDVYWSLDEGGRPNTLGILHDLLVQYGLPTWLIVAITAVVELVGLPTRRAFMAGPRRPVIAHSIPALGFSYLEDVLVAMGGWADANPGDAVFLRLNHERGPGPQFNASDAALLEALVGSTGMLQAASV